MHCDMLKIQDGVAIVEKLNCDNVLIILAALRNNFHPGNRASPLVSVYYPGYIFLTMAVDGSKQTITRNNSYSRLHLIKQSSSECRYLLFWLAT